jgi:Family of unknown function (DUF5995)
LPTRASEAKEDTMESTEHRSMPGAGLSVPSEGDRTAYPGWLDRHGVDCRPRTVHEARRALDIVTAAFTAEGDARAAFADVYGIITRRVAESIEISERHPGPDAHFWEPQWTSRLSGLFCERYLETLAWSLGGGIQDAGAWEVTYGAARQRGVFPLQHVLLGLSAHINYDLAVGIHRNIVERGRVDGATLRRYKHDHDAVNDLLRASIPEAFDHLIQRHRCLASAILYRRTYAIAEWATMRILCAWRARVWEDAMAMLSAPNPEAEAAIVRRLDRVSSRYARLLAIPGAHPLGAALDTLH